MESVCISTSALHLICVCSVSEREVRKALKQLLFRLLHLKTHLQNGRLHQRKTTPFEATGAAVCGFHNEVE